MISFSLRFSLFTLVALAGLFLPTRAAAAGPSQQSPTEVDQPKTVSGSVWLELDPWTLHELGWDVAATGAEAAAAEPTTLDFVVLPSSTIRAADDGAQAKHLTGRAHMPGALLVLGLGERIVVEHLSIGPTEAGLWTIEGRVTDTSQRHTIFELSSILTDYSASEQNLRVSGELSVSAEWARFLGRPRTAGIVVGAVAIDVMFDGGTDLAITEEDLEAGFDQATNTSSTGMTAGSIGPDILVADLQSVYRFGRVGNITGYAVGTNACNIGDQRADWVSGTNAHPVIVMNMYRLLGGRFEQIGMSWVKHGFYAVSQSLCMPCLDPTNGTQLGVGCSDPYSAMLNGVQSNMSLRSDVNASTGYFPYPWVAPDPENAIISKRLQVHDVDLAPGLNDGAMYFVQGHYVAADDAAAGNNNNNASYRRVDVRTGGHCDGGPNDGQSCYTTDHCSGFPCAPFQPYAFDVAVKVAWPTQRGKPAIEAWFDNDPSVERTDIVVPNDGLFILGAKATDLGTGYWRYEYAIQNLNSDRSAGAFSVPFSPGTVIDNIGFHDVDYHSGERYDLRDWSPVLSTNAITWSTQSYESNRYANALRFSTLYNFRFDANVAPEPAVVTIGIFKPGDPSEVSGRSIGPSLCADPGDDDNDGTANCFDLCPDTLPNTCTCPPVGLCCFNTGFCVPQYPRVDCIEDGGTPDCVEPQCRAGCLLGDADNDADWDLLDSRDFFICFSGPTDGPGYVPPTHDCAKRFDFDNDSAIDLADLAGLVGLCSGPK